MREAGIKEGLPADAIGCMTTATIEGHRSADEAQADGRDPGDGRHWFGARGLFFRASRPSVWDQVMFRCSLNERLTFPRPCRIS